MVIRKQIRITFFQNYINLCVKKIEEENFYFFEENLVF